MYDDYEEDSELESLLNQIEEEAGREEPELELEEEGDEPEIEDDSKEESEKEEKQDNTDKEEQDVEDEPLFEVEVLGEKQKVTQDVAKKLLSEPKAEKTTEEKLLSQENFTAEDLALLRDIKNGDVTAINKVIKDSEVELESLVDLEDEYNPHIEVDEFADVVNFIQTNDYVEKGFEKVLPVISERNQDLIFGDRDMLDSFSRAMKDSDELGQVLKYIPEETQGVLLSDKRVFEEFYKEVKTGRVKEVVRDLVIEGLDGYDFAQGFAEKMSKERKPTKKKIDNAVDDIKENNQVPDDEKKIDDMSDEEFDKVWGYGDYEEY